MNKKFQNQYRIKSTRLKQWDYASVGGYFVTVCVKDRQCVFGDVIGGKIRLNELGKTADQCWRDIPGHFPRVDIDEYVIMPNHIHGIIMIGSKPVKYVRRDEALPRLYTYGGQRPAMSSISPRPGSLPVIIGSYKSIVAKLVRKGGAPSFAWQARYHDHVIRDDADLNRVRPYIASNPQQWDDDAENPAKARGDVV